MKTHVALAHDPTDEPVEQPDSPASAASTDSLVDLDAPSGQPPVRPGILDGLRAKLGLPRDTVAQAQISESMGLELRASRRTSTSPSQDGARDRLMEPEPGTPLDPRRGSQMPPKAQGIRWSRVGLVQAIAVIPFVLLLYGAFIASQKPIAPSTAPLLFYNGSSYFAPTTILISFDGFRADFLHRGLTPVLNAFIREGVSPRWMLPSFPSLTFPNHWTLVTGLHPESHGIVANGFWDPASRSQFQSSDTQGLLQPKWWAGEAVWETAEKAGRRTAIHMWPGSEVPRDVGPSYVDKYNGHELLSNKVDRILGLLDLPGRNDSRPVRNKPRPELIAAYVPDVDLDGHLFGPNSTEIHQTIARADAMVGQLSEGLKSRNLTDIVNVIIVSDHGMATTSASRLVQIDDMIDMDKIEYHDGWPHYGLRPRHVEDLRPLYDQLKAEAAKSTGFDVYLRDVDMPARYHFSKNERIAPLWVIPRAGWAIVTRKDFDANKALKTGEVFHPRGAHGYDNEHPLMRSIFVARGPAFPHPPGSKIDVFRNTEVYNIVCDSLQITPGANNGTLRLPFDNVGKHTSPPPGEIPDEPAD